MGRCSSASGSRRSQRETCVACPAIEIKCAQFEVLKKKIAVIVKPFAWTPSSEQGFTLHPRNLYNLLRSHAALRELRDRQSAIECRKLCSAFPARLGTPILNVLVECGTSAELRHRCYPPLAGRKLAFEWLCGSLVYLPVTLNFTQVLSFFKLAC